MHILADGCYVFSTSQSGRDDQGYLGDYTSLFSRRISLLGKFYTHTSNQVFFSVIVRTRRKTDVATMTAGCDPLGILTQKGLTSFN